MLDTVNDIGHNIGMSTENGIWLALDEITQSKEPLTVFSSTRTCRLVTAGYMVLDSSPYPVYKGKGAINQGHSYIDVPMLLDEYRRKVNPNCHVYSVQIGGYSDNVLPEFYPKTSILSGLSQEILRLLYMEQKPESVEAVFRDKFGLNKKRSA